MIRRVFRKYQTLPKRRSFGKLRKKSQSWAADIFAVRFHGAILMNGGAYNTADETNALDDGGCTCPVALRVAGLGTVSSTAAGAAIGAANEFE